MKKWPKSAQIPEISIVITFFYQEQTVTIILSDQGVLWYLNPYKNHYAKVIMISWWNKRFSANNLILLTSAFGLGHKIILPQFTTFTGNNDLFLSALRASRNKRIIFCFKSFISSLDHYDLHIIIIFALNFAIDILQK